MTEEERAQMFLDEVQEQADLPTVKLSPTGSCYNYSKLKKEGLVENPDESDVIEAEKEFTPENDPYGGY
tara:strand:+ start:800 stop:1006 length:207 start_codon:yes stop_codon:yes gene_type:complete